MGSKFFGFWIGFLAAAITSGAPSFGALSESDKASIPFRNLLTNPGAENGLAGVTVSGGTLTRTTEAISTGSVGEGNAAFSWDSNASGQTLTFTPVAIPAGFYAKDAALFCNFKTPIGTATHTMSVWDGVTATQPVSITSSANYVNSVINFTMPSSGNISLQIKSVNADEPAIKIDSCGILSAEGYNIFHANLAASSDIRLDTYTAGSQYATVNTNVFRYSNVSYNTGTAFTPTLSSSLGASVTINEDGLYCANGAYRDDGANSYTYISKNSLTSGDSNTIANSGFQSGVSRSVHAPAACFNAVIGDVIRYLGTGTTDQSSASNNANGFLHIIKVSSSLKTIFTFDTTASSWTGYHTAGGATWSRTNTVYGSMTPTGTAAIVERLNTNFGTVTTAASNLPGITFTPKGAYKYEVCAYPKLATGSVADFGAFKLTDGTAVIGEYSYRDVANAANSVPICGQYQASGTSPVTLEIQCKKQSASCEIIGTASAGVASIEWDIVAISQSFPAPLIANAVTSKSALVEGTERARLTLSSSCAIASQSGSWLSSCTRTAAGQYEFAINPNVFSASPTCNITAGDSNLLVRIRSVTSTLGTFWLPDPASAMTLTDGSGDFHVNCQGPR